MPADRYFLNDSFIIDQTYEIQEQEFLHLTRVMRAQIGQHIELVNGKGALAQATIEQILKKKATLRIVSLKSQKPPLTELILAQAIPRLNRLDFILEKGTELGMTQIWLFPGQLSERNHLTPHQIEHIQNVMTSALKQCGRLFLPRCEIKPPLKQWNEMPFTSFFGDTAKTAPLFEQQWKRNTDSKGIIFIIGPESGFSEAEIKKLTQLNAQGVKLHENILRTDTAALTALSLISHWTYKLSLHKG